MQVVFRLSYSLAVGLLIVLFVILGTRTFYDEPNEPRFNQPPAPVPFDQQSSEEYQARYRAFEEERADYHRNVFIISTILGVASVLAGVYLYRRVEAMPLGLLLGGIGVLIFGWAQAAEDFGEIGEAPVFVAVAIGLAVVLAAGYRFLRVSRDASVERAR